MRAASSVGLCPSHFAVKIAKTIQLTFSRHKISLMLCTGNHILIHIRVPSYMMCENIITSDKEGGKCVCPRSFVCLSVCLCARLLKSACMDLDEMLRVDRYRDINELINF